MSLRDLFVEEARGVTVGEAMHMLPLGKLVAISATGEHAGPCPACGGTDRFGVNAQRNAWVCRGSAGGRDAIGLAGHVLGLDLRRQEGLLAACAALLGRAPPDGIEESDADRRQREARIEARKAENARAEARREAAAFDHREAERAKARGKWQNAEPEGEHSFYLARRFDCYARDLPVAPFLRTSPAETYWHGTDDRGNAVDLHCGPAMVAPFVDPSGLVIGCHLTWIDLKRRPKFRPLIRDPAAPRGEPLVTKKMRGSKTGGLIPLIGFYQDGPLILPDLNRHRFVVGEGIETVLAVALVEGPRADTIYAAAGDIGNLAGPAEPTSRFAHPTLKKADKNGVKRAVMVQGAVPRADQSPDAAMQAPPCATEIVLLADGDSEVHATAAAMARAKRRFEAVCPNTETLWPQRGLDFADHLNLFPLGH